MLPEPQRYSSQSHQHADLVCKSLFATDEDLSRQLSPASLKHDCDPQVSLLLLPAVLSLQIELYRHLSILYDQV